MSEFAIDLIRGSVVKRLVEPLIVVYPEPVSKSFLQIRSIVEGSWLLHFKATLFYQYFWFPSCSSFSSWLKEATSFSVTQGAGAAAIWTAPSDNK
jgi:hypothetical protein